MINEIIFNEITIVMIKVFMMNNIISFLFVFQSNSTNTNNHKEQYLDFVFHLEKIKLSFQILQDSDEFHAA